MYNMISLFLPALCLHLHVLRSVHMLHIEQLIGSFTRKLWQNKGGRWVGLYKQAAQRISSDTWIPISSSYRPATLGIDSAVATGAGYISVYIPSQNQTR